LSAGDQEGALRVTLAITPSDSCIVGTVLDELCHHCLVVVPILPILGVWDIDGVVLVAFWVVGDKSDWGFIGVIVEGGSLMFIVNGAFFIDDGEGLDGKLWGKTNGGDGVIIRHGMGDKGDRG
jgi:hypothetical protein